MSALPLDQRLAAVELGLRHVGDLAASTAKGLGKDKTQRQILVFATGVFKQSVLEAKEQWDAGAAAARTSGAASGTDARPVPFKWQLLRMVIEALQAQGLSGEVLAELQALEISCLEAMFLSATDTDRPVILTFLFRPTQEGLQALDLFTRDMVRHACAKKGGDWAPCGIRQRRYLPNRQVRTVLTDLGYPDEAVNAYWKGKGRGAAGVSPAGGAKRPAERRGSAVARDDGRSAKR